MIALLIMSAKFTFDEANWDKWSKNTLTYLAPALIIFLTAIQVGVPVKEALYSLYLWALNVVIDWLKKFVSTQ